MLINCPCGQTNRVPGASTKRFRCGKCRHQFTPQELMHARPEAPPRRFSLDQEDLDDDENDEQDED